MRMEKVTVCVGLPGSFRIPCETGVAAPTVEELFDYAVEQISMAAREVWPGEWLRLAEHVPSVTGYVQCVEVDDRTFFAKYSYLGSCALSRFARPSYWDVPGSNYDRCIAWWRRSG